MGKGRLRLHCMPISSLAHLIQPDSGYSRNITRYGSWLDLQGPQNSSAAKLCCSLMQSYGPFGMGHTIDLAMVGSKEPFMQESGTCASVCVVARRFPWYRQTMRT